MPVLLGSHGLVGHGARDAAHRRGQERARGGTRHHRRLVWLQRQSQQLTTEQMIQRQIRQVMSLHLLALRLGIDIQTIVACLREEANDTGVWFGAVPASATAVAGLEKQTFVHATTEEGECGGGGMDECAICFEDFEDGEEVSVMPCSHRHEFHPNCIGKWLARSNTCPLCRHELPTAGGVDDGQ
ncbi:unnamed protein product [Urochloa humidicola]